MKCEDCLLIIEEYIDGELDKQDVGRVTAHIADCSSCASICEELRHEQEIYAFYRRDVDVTPALWEGIHTRIKEEQTARSSSFLSRLNGWFALVFSAPRFSPALAIVLMAPDKVKPGCAARRAGKSIPQKALYLRC